MSLFVRLDVGFWSHRKTLRLRALIGDSALWIPPRLWSYAAQSQPDGDFSDYQPTELAMLLGYSGDAQAMLEALQRASFMDGMKIHGWDDHNGYHAVYSERAKKAAAARWKGNEKKITEKTGEGEDKRREEQASPSNASSIPKNGTRKKRAARKPLECEGFKQFWESYPRREAIANAEEAWVKNGCKEFLPKILTTVRSLKITDQWTKDGGRFVPHAATWLNRRGWEDELLTNTAVNNHTEKSKYGF